MIKANNPLLKSWIEVKKNSDFPIQNLPFGIFKTASLSPRVGVAIGNFVMDIAMLQQMGFLKNNFSNTVFETDFLNDFIALGKQKTRELRNRISELLTLENAELRDNPEARKKNFHEQKNVQLLMPVKIGDYTDFYSSIEHATNVGSMFRDPKNALLPNWKHLPVAYHGRASSITVSGTNFHRPKGQTKPADAENPVFGATKLLDFELEMAFIIGKNTKMGESISTENADDFIFGMVLFNDWSARDMQTWEYVPLGPFLAKNFASTISPWIVTLDALEPFRVACPSQDPEVLPYLQFKGNKNIDIQLEVLIQPENQEPTSISHSNFKYMYWNMEQQLAHHTVNGCNVNVGDMMASGTISGPIPSSYGSMLELTWRGTKPIKMIDGSERKFINDGDSVIMRGFAEKENVRIGFGEVKAKVLPTL
ncbi:MAG: fumarylacetoacetase [Bacteroidia bacterium]